MSKSIYRSVGLHVCLWVFFVGICLVNDFWLVSSLKCLFWFRYVSISMDLLLFWDFWSAKMYELYIWFPRYFLLLLVPLFNGKIFPFFQQFREFGKSDSTNCNCTIQSYNHHHHRRQRRRHCSRHHTRTIFKIAFGSIMVWFSLVLVLLSLFLEISPPPFPLNKSNNIRYRLQISSVDIMSSPSIEC